MEKRRRLSFLVNIGGGELLNTRHVQHDDEEEAFFTPESITWEDLFNAQQDGLCNYFVCDEEDLEDSPLSLG